MPDLGRCAHCGQQITDQQSMREVDGQRFCSEQHAQQYLQSRSQA